jgi:hypothetical protein
MQAASSGRQTITMRPGWSESPPSGRATIGAGRGSVCSAQPPSTATAAKPVAIVRENRPRRRGGRGIESWLGRSTRKASGAGEARTRARYAALSVRIYAYGPAPGRRDDRSAPGGGSRQPRPHILQRLPPLGQVGRTHAKSGMHRQIAAGIDDREGLLPSAHPHLSNRCRYTRGSACGS